MHYIQNSKEINQEISDEASGEASKETGGNFIYFAVENIHCGGCIKKIESSLLQLPFVESCRLNFSTSRLKVNINITDKIQLQQEENIISQIQNLLKQVGYTAFPYSFNKQQLAEEKELKQLLKALAVAGFGAGNIMLLAIATWAGYSQGMPQETRMLFHWLSLMIAIPIVIYSGMPFYKNAFKALSRGATNMDVPISSAVILASIISINQTIHEEKYVYFDSAIMLLFFLLIGRFLDKKARKKAKFAVQDLLSINNSVVNIITENGKITPRPASKASAGLLALVKAGEVIPVDGIIEDGESEVNTASFDGETMPKLLKKGDEVFASMVNISSPIKIRIKTVGEATQLAEILKTLEALEGRKNRFTQLSDKLVKLYTPIVHILGVFTFILWYFIWGASWQQAALYAVAVLIITCPCALGLAVPAVQVISGSRLLKKGVILKNPQALEKISQVQNIAFDKTGTLTSSKPIWINKNAFSAEEIEIANLLASHSDHPISRAICENIDASNQALQDGFHYSFHLPIKSVKEHAGRAITGVLERGGRQIQIALGSKGFIFGLNPDFASKFSGEIEPDMGCEVNSTYSTYSPYSTHYADYTHYDHSSDSKISVNENCQYLHSYLLIDGEIKELIFQDKLRVDAKMVVDVLKQQNYNMFIISGDREEATKHTAKTLGISEYYAKISPLEKHKIIAKKEQEDGKILMVGDGINDAVALAAAFCSLSPASATDIAKSTADAVFTGSKLKPIIDFVHIGKIAQKRIRQNLYASITYNILAVPLAIFGIITPLIASVLMSFSSLSVVLNSFRK